MKYIGMLYRFNINKVIAKKISTFIYFQEKKNNDWII